MAVDVLDFSVLNDLESRMDYQETVVLESFDELKVLVKLFGSSFSDKPHSLIKNTSGCWQLSKNIEEFDEETFDNVYHQWLSLTNRDNNMDEHGQLLY